MRRRYGFMTGSTVRWNQVQPMGFLRFSKAVIFQREISLSEDLLKKQVMEIMRTDYGIAVCVENVEKN